MSSSNFLIKKINTGDKGIPIAATEFTEFGNTAYPFNVQYFNDYKNNYKIDGVSASNFFNRGATVATVETSYNFYDLLKGSIAGDDTRVLFKNMSSFHVGLYNTGDNATNGDWVFDFIYFNIPVDLSSKDGVSTAGGVSIKSEDIECLYESSDGSIFFDAINVKYTFIGYERFTFTPDSNGYFNSFLNDGDITENSALYNLYTSNFMFFKPSGVLIIPRTKPTDNTCRLNLWTSDSDGFMYNLRIASAGGIYA